MRAFVEMLERDKNRFHDALKRINQSPLGAAALAGTTFPKLSRDLINEWMASK